MIELTEEQHRAVEARLEPLRMVDPRTQKAYVLVPVGVYDRLKRVLEEVDPSFYEFDEPPPH